jgi:carbon starvation protein
LFVPSTVQIGTNKPVATWALVWSLFGTSNQLLAGLTLLAVTVWLGREKRRLFLITFLPTLFMLLVTLWSLCLWIDPLLGKVAKGDFLVDTFLLNGFGAAVLFVLAIILIVRSGVIVVRDSLQGP